VRHPIYLFRHGETVWNAEKRAQGQLDSPLTEAGREQARRMGQALAQELVQAGYAPRARDAGDRRRGRGLGA
jgi:broad specificity phosphatase PhoE